MFNAQCIESGSYSLGILHGMKMLTDETSLTDGMHFNGSTEENVSTIQTGLGVTVGGVVPDENFYVGS